MVSKDDASLKIRAGAASTLKGRSSALLFVPKFLDVSPNVDRCPIADRLTPTSGVSHVMGFFPLGPISFKTRQGRVTFFGAVFFLPMSAMSLYSWLSKRAAQDSFERPVLTERSNRD